MEPNSLKRRTLHSIFWMVVSIGWASAASFITFAVLARLLDPIAFGTFALAQSLFVLVTQLISSGFNDATIQRRDLVEELADTMFWANLSLGVFVASLIWAGADVYASLVNVPEVASPLRWLAAAIPIEVAGAIHLARRLRNFGHKIVALRTVASSLVAGAVAIGAASQGMGVWSLVLQVWVTSVLNCGLAWNGYRWVPRFRFSWILLRSVLPYCGAVMANRLLLVLTPRIPELVIGRLGGPAAVGHYRVGWRLIEVITISLLGPLSSVAMSTFSSLSGNRKDLSAAYLRLLHVGAASSLPVIIGCGFLANELVVGLFGTQWKDSAYIVQILCIMAFPQAVTFLISVSLSATASMSALTTSNVVQLTVTSVLTSLFAPWGVAAITGAYVARSYITLPYLQRVLTKSTGATFAQCERSVRVPILGTLLMLLTIYLIGPSLRLYLSSDWQYVISVILVGGITYSIVMIAFDRQALWGYIALWKGQVP